MSGLEIRLESPESAEATALIAALDRRLNELYPTEPVFGIDAARFERDGGAFAVGRSEGRAVAIGALRPVGRDVELKRMFVAPECRGQGFARQMLAFLETEAVRRGYARLLLETGMRQHEAIALYESSGYRKTDPFGIYLASPISRFYEKFLEIGDVPEGNTTPPARY